MKTEIITIINRSMTGNSLIIDRDYAEQVLLPKMMDDIY